ncbi:MATE family efflux transporter [Halalkalibacter hemicellulosilyticus]|uniref:Multi antimicrobial extrusion protein n=1 Tax=Halalkalibacter hemicellulosilyticusJCM 9152 TaxID=1236971 RepID=W4QGF2_9BACI|nr:MATE family efflux transporter [Halalkalibacter hemicellulosilyticus]GAE31190.1 multi antimicrobial extrusion protein [Halalkalibacter hemicellulosilyticusJCM 9152]
MDIQQKNKKKIQQLSLFALTWPIFIEIMLHMIMGNADTLMLSQYSDDAVAAVGVANQIFMFVIVMFGFIATGTSVLVAQHLGAKQQREAGQVAVVSIGANLAIGLILSIGLILFGAPLLTMMGLPEELLQEATMYMVIVGGFSFVQALLMTVSAILRSYQFTKDVMYVTIGMNILNIIGNYLFIFGAFGMPVLGVTGVAISTAVSRCIGLAIVAYLLYRRIPNDLPFPYLLKGVPKVELRNLLKIGIPTAGEHMFYNGSQLVIMYFILMFGAEELTTRVYVQNVTMFALLFGLAVGQGTQIIVGYQVGAKQLDAAYKRCIRSLKLAILISLGMSAIFYFLSNPILSIFTDNPDIIALGSILLLLHVIMEPGRSFNLVVINCLRAAGDVKFPVYLGVISMWGVSIPVAYFFGIYLDMGLVGIWLGMVADEWLRGFLMYIRWRGGKWREMAFVGKRKEQDVAVS